VRSHAARCAVGDSRPSCRLLFDVRTGHYVATSKECVYNTGYMNSQYKTDILYVLHRSVYVFVAVDSTHDEFENMIVGEG